MILPLIAGVHEKGKLTDVQRKDFYQEIRIAINRMTDEIGSLLGFSKQRQF